MLDLAPTTRTARLQALLASIDDHASPAKMLLYSGARPAAGGTPVGVLQATVTLQKPCGVVVGQTLVFNVPAEGQRLDDLDIAWVRITNGANAWRVDGNAGLLSPEGGDPDPEDDLLFDDTGGNIGAFIRLTAGGISE